LTDFGVQDTYAGVLEAVIARIAPEAHVLHLSHGVPPQAVSQGALMLADAVPYLPVGVHVAVVDPGVGTSRRAIAVESPDGRRFVGPDNGLLPAAAEAGGGIVAVHELTNAAYRLEGVSATFHGRDLFAPAAAHLALGVAVGELGPAVDPAELVRLPRPYYAVSDGRIESDCVLVDRFGNSWVAVTPDEAEEAGITLGDRVSVTAAGRQRGTAVRARTFGEVGERELVLYATSWGRLALGVRGGDAARTLGCAPGDRIRLDRLT
jgi:S-adenosyl-L-methionine hydrolase (adenosine-forming)